MKEVLRQVREEKRLFTDVRFLGLAELRKAVSPLRSATALQTSDLAKKESRNCGELKGIGEMWSEVAACHGVARSAKTEGEVRAGDTALCL
jgi:hypothetical protein